MRKRGNLHDKPRYNLFSITSRAKSLFPRTLNENTSGTVKPRQAAQIQLPNRQTRTCQGQRAQKRPPSRQTRAGPRSACSKADSQSTKTSLIHVGSLKSSLLIDKIGIPNDRKPAISLSICNVCRNIRIDRQRERVRSAILFKSASDNVG